MPLKRGVFRMTHSLQIYEKYFLKLRNNLTENEIQILECCCNSIFYGRLCLRNGVEEWGSGLCRRKRFGIFFCYCIFNETIGISQIGR